MTTGELEFVYDQAEESESTPPIGFVTTYTYTYPPDVLSARKRKVREKGATDPYPGGVTTFIYDRERGLLGCVQPDGTFWRASALGLVIEESRNRQKPPGKIEKNQDSKNRDSQEGNA